MTPYFSSPQRVDLLNRVANSWMGTPFWANACIKGRGVSCQKLVGAIMSECGVLPLDYAAPDGPMEWARTNTRSLISEELDGLPQFQKVFDRSLADGGAASSPVGCTGDRSTLSLLPGDILGIKWGGCVQHIAVVINDVFAVHVIRKHSVCTLSLTDAAAMGNLWCVWRPIE